MTIKISLSIILFLGLVIFVGVLVFVIFVTVFMGDEQLVQSAVIKNVLSGNNFNKWLGISRFKHSVYRKALFF